MFCVRLGGGPDAGSLGVFKVEYPTVEWAKKAKLPLTEWRVMLCFSIPKLAVVGTLEQAIKAYKEGRNSTTEWIRPVNLDVLDKAINCGMVRWIDGSMMFLFGRMQTHKSSSVTRKLMGKQFYIAKALQWGPKRMDQMLEALNDTIIAWKWHHNILPVELIYGSNKR